MEKRREGATLVDTAMDEIIQLILDRNMQAGGRLPNEYDLAQQLGVGRSTLREATRRLVSRNILEVRHGAGTFVSEKHGVPEDPLGLTFLEDDPGLALDLLEIRLMLEPEISAQVAAAATEEDIARLEACCDELDRLMDAGQDYAEADKRFHRCLAQCSGNRVLQNLIPVITSSIKVSIFATRDEHRESTKRLHRQILEAIRRHDPAGARYTMIAHLNTNRASLSEEREQDITSSDGN